MSELNYDLDDAKDASAIMPRDETIQAQLSDIYKQLESSFGPAHVDGASAAFFKKGSTKSIKPGFDLVEYLKNINYIIYDYIISTNNKMTPKQKSLIKTYLDSSSKLHEILKSVDIEVAQNEFLSYIIGYNIKVIKAYYDRHKQV